MTAFLQTFNGLIGLIMFILYFYQVIYVLVALYRRRAARAQASAAQAEETALHRYAVLIPARNEEKVIGNLIDSLKEQRYPTGLIDVYVVADNCTDETARVARGAGAVVLERFNREQVGKGYALDYALKEIFAHYERTGKYDAFVVFDADNLVDENFFTEINRCFDGGARIITSYRNAKNFGESWVASCSGLWYLRESRFLNSARAALGSSCLISGTGFVVARDILARNNGWKHHLLTEDIEFSVDQVIEGEKVVFCESALIYDEQPVTFRQSWDQRLRWAKGFYQVFRRYGGRMAKKLARCPKEEKLSCYDLLMMILPAMLITVAGVAANLAALIVGAACADASLMRAAGITLWMTAVNFYLMFLGYGALTMVTERGYIQAPLKARLVALAAFPVFTASYMPMSIQALMRKVEWKPIAHTSAKRMDELKAKK